MLIAMVPTPQNGTKEATMLIKTDSSSPNLQKSSSYPRQKIERLSDVFGVSRPSADSHIQSLPFSPDDVTAGSENECQCRSVGHDKTRGSPHHPGDFEFLEKSD